MKTNILFNKSALEIVLKQLKKTGYVWRNIKPLNRERYFIIEGFGCDNIAICFKREFFFTFGQMRFIDQEGREEKGLGETVNTEHLKRFVTEQVKTLYFVYPDSKIYHISIIDFLTLSHRWVNKENTEVRSISIHKLKRLEQC